jgi:hypothetical protein
MKHFGAELDMYQDVGVNPTVIFQTAGVNVRLIDSNGNGIQDGQGKVLTDQWRWLGKTDANGDLFVELLPKNYKFRMKHFGAELDMYQDVGVNPTVVYQTIHTIVKLEDANQNGLQGGEARVLTDQWRWLGKTDDRGNVMAELLSKNYKFRMTYQGLQKDKYQDIGNNATVLFTYANGSLYGAEVNASEQAILPNSLRVFPNPVSGDANVWVTITQPGFTQLTVYDMNGQLVRILQKGDLQADAYRIDWNTTNLKAGTYILQLVNGNDVQTLPVIVVNE